MIVVIGILAAITIIAFNGVQNSAHNSAVQSDLNNGAKKLTEYRALHGQYPLTRAEFRAAGLKFSLDSHRHSVFCAWEEGEPNFALVSYSTGGERYYISSSEGLRDYTGSFPSNSGVCTAAGGTAPTASAWLRGSGDWTSWVVY